DVGAPAGTPVFAPIDGTIASVSDYLVAGQVEGYEVLIEPSRGASIAVRATQLDPVEGVEIGTRVSAGADVIGRVRDLSRVAELPVGRFTADAGNSVHLEVLATGNIPVG
ncbi:MAG: M23 family metallopeptidase, partial [Thermoleophilia bacterium]|nr:M23 family metallopeptidase [Thermoleophilia bacterium]